MKTTICSFADVVARDYGEEVAMAFREQFADASQEIGFEQAMGALSGVLRAWRVPKFSRTGFVTDSPQQQRTLKHAR